MTIEAVKDKTDALTKILFAVAAMFFALLFLKIGFFVNSSDAMMVVAEADPNRMGADDLQKVLAETKASANEIKKKNLFVPGPLRQNPAAEVIGILGQEALIGEKWYKVGDSVGDAKIIAIEPTKVRVAWDGQEKEFMPIGSGRTGDQGGRGGPPRSGPGSSGKMAGAGARRGGGGPTGGMSASDMQSFRERLKNASSPEDRRRIIEEMRQKRSRGQ